MLDQKIESATAELWRVPLEQTLGGGRITHADMIVVDLATDQGLAGRGFGLVIGAPGEVPFAAAKQLLAAEVAGRPLGHPEEFARRMRAAIVRYGLGTFGAGMAAADLALWDLYGKALGLPAGVAMGGAARPVPVYRSFEFGETMDAVMEKTEAAFAAGYTAVKLHSYPTPEDAAIIDAVGEYVSDRGYFMVDSTQRCTLLQASWLAEVIADAGALWFEEPIATSEIGAYRQLARTSRVAIATGENLRGLAEAQTFLSEGLCRVLQPDFFKMGGLTECLRVARAAEACSIDVAPHFSPLIAAHLAAAQPNVVWLEELPLVEFLFGGTPSPDADGRLCIGDKPGLGLDWDDGLAAEYRVSG